MKNDSRKSQGAPIELKMTRNCSSSISLIPRIFSSMIISAKASKYTVAPFDFKKSTISGWLPEMAHLRGVAPNLSTQFNRAPLSTRSFTISMWPCCAAGPGATQNRRLSAIRPKRLHVEAKDINRSLRHAPKCSGVRLS